MRIEDQLAEAISLHNSNMSKAEIHERCVNALKLVGIPEPEMTLRNYPHELSGGMCQRVMIAMAMSCEPKLLIADEPTTALDVTIQAQILALMEDIRNRRNTGILLITHDLGVVAETCSRAHRYVRWQYCRGSTGQRAVRQPAASLHRGPYRFGTAFGQAPASPAARSPAPFPICPSCPRAAVSLRAASTAQDSCKQKLPELQTVSEGHRCACPFYRNAREGAQQDKRVQLRPSRCCPFVT